MKKIIKHMWTAVTFLFLLDVMSLMSHVELEESLQSLGEYHFMDLYN